jgi:hypothetical protein
MSISRPLSSGQTDQFSPAAAVLLALLRRSPRTAIQLAAAGLAGDLLSQAIGELRRMGHVIEDGHMGCRGN